MVEHWHALLIESFKAYYGLDWLATALFTISSYFFARRHPSAFLLTAAALTASTFCAFATGQRGFVLGNALQLFFMLRGYLAARRAIAPLVPANDDKPPEALPERGLFSALSA